MGIIEAACTEGRTWPWRSLRTHNEHTMANGRVTRKEQLVSEYILQYMHRENWKDACKTTPGVYSTILVHAK